MRTKKNKIFINGRFLTRNITGVERFALELVKALDKNVNDEMEFILLVPKKSYRQHYEFKNIKIKKIGSSDGHLWEQLELPFHSKGGLLISLCNTAPLLKRKQVVTIHDASIYGFPDAYSFIFKCWYKIIYKWMKYASKKIITVSQFSKNELIKYCGYNKNHVEVIIEGKEHIFENDSENKIINDNSLKQIPYILAVSSMNPNKNFKSIIKALEVIDKKYKVVIAGGVNPKVFKSSSTEDLGENILHVGYVSDGELRTLYEHASIFVYPSFYEGFGLPPLEAMSLGCPVIVSERASMPEICDNAAIYCNPDNPMDIAQKIQLLMDNDDLRIEMSEKGVIRSTNFSWEKSAQQVLDIIRSIS